MCYVVCYVVNRRKRVAISIKSRTTHTYENSQLFSYPNVINASLLVKFHIYVFNNKKIEDGSSNIQFDKSHQCEQFYIVAYNFINLLYTAAEI